MIWKTTLAFLVAFLKSLGIFRTIEIRILQPIPLQKKGFLLLLLLGFALNQNLFSQNNSCSQNNFFISEIEFRDASGVAVDPNSTTYDVGDQLSGTIYVTFGGSTSNASALYVTYDIFQNNVLSENDSLCVFQNVQIERNTPLYIDDFTWTWGDKFEIKNLFMRWQTGGPKANCPSADTTGAQCYGNELGFLVRTPLVANFSYAQSCDSYEVSFTDLSTGGNTTNYSYVWDFGTLGTRNVKNPSITFPKPGVYNYEVTLTTNDGSVSSSYFDTI